jgi:hypothetical protein
LGREPENLKRAKIRLPTYQGQYYVHMDPPNTDNHLTDHKTEKKTNKLHGLSPRANYTDRATAKLVPTFVDRGCHVVSITYAYDCILDFPDQKSYFSFK